MSDPTQGSTATDTDQQETREWMDALSAVIDREGAERAHFLIEQLLEHARSSTFPNSHAPGNSNYIRYASAFVFEKLVTFVVKAAVMSDVNFEETHHRHVNFL